MVKRKKRVISTKIKGNLRATRQKTLFLDFEIFYTSGSSAGQTEHESGTVSEQESQSLLGGHRTVDRILVLEIVSGSNLKYAISLKKIIR